MPFPRFMRYFLVLMLIAFSMPFQSHAQYWMQAGGGLTIDEGYDIAIDASGNSYTTGYFTGTATFGGTTLTSSGSSDIFVAKVDNQGNHVWAQKAGGSGSDRGLSIAVDGAGNSYITGYFYNTATFGGQSVSSSGLQDVFIAKYDPSGNVVWVEKAGGAGADIGNGICIDNSGNVGITGEFAGSATFGGTSLNSQLGSTDVFITKLDNSGAFQWTEQGAGNFTDRGLDITCDNLGNFIAVGQFSDTITFDQTHNNSMLNVVFVIKYDGAGTEQWFEVIGGGASSTAHAVTSDGSGNIYLTGDFTGNLTFFNTPNVTITNPNPNKIFVARYSSSGSLGWAVADGSMNAITAQGIALDGSGGPFIVGHFDCVLTDYSDVFGSGTFNTVGYNDVFISKYGPTGTWLNSRNVGGRKNDYGYGIAVNSAGQAIFAGSFFGDIHFPVSSNFLTGNLANWTQVPLCPGNANYCSDPDYDNYYTVDGAGNSDVIIANWVDFGRSPYDYFKRSGGGCNPFQDSVCNDAGCPDSLINCQSVTPTADPKYCPSIGPIETYSWSNGDTAKTTNISTSGTHWVRHTSDDGCFTSIDTFEVLILPAPPPPDITDSKGININSISPLPIDLCDPDSVLLTGGGFGTNPHLWTGPGLGTGSTAVSIMVTQSGNYHFQITDPQGCIIQTIVSVIIHTDLPPFQPVMVLDDTVQVCENSFFTAFLYDSITNPIAAPLCLNQVPYTLMTTFTSSPAAPVVNSCQTFGFYSPNTNGLYTVMAQIVRYNPCDTDTHVLSKLVYVELLPAPVIVPYSIQMVGSSYYCPGASTKLYVTGGPPGSYTWNGPGVSGNNNDTVFVSSPGIVTITSTVNDTNAFGCSESFSVQQQKTIAEKPQPNVTSTSLLICPGDSVKLTTTGGTYGNGYSWEGPNGPIGGDADTVWVSDPGIYFVVINDADSCDLVSNTVVLNQYTTPELQIVSPFLCDGDSAFITVVANNGSIIEWQLPLSGSALQETVYAPGIYTCKITSCGIETFASVEIFPSYVESNVTSSGVLCEGDSIDLIGSPGMETYTWAPSGDTTSTITIYNPGTYTLTTSDSNGCVKESDPFMVIIDQDSIIISIGGYPVLCEGDTMVLTGNTNMNSYLWLPGNATTPTLAVTQAGTYTLTAIDPNGCVGESEPLELTTPGTVADIDALGDLLFCEDDSVIFFALDPNKASFRWTPGDSTGDSLVLFQSGTYALTTVDTFGCEAFSDPLTANMEPNNLNMPLVEGVTICAGAEVTLEAFTDLGIVNWYDSTGGGTPLWTGPSFTIPTSFKTTTYYVFSELSVCSSVEAPVTVEVLNCDSIFVPNVFTPNGDGVNDLFLVQMFNTTCFNTKIYNRWGMLIFEMISIGQGWDGTVQETGRYVPEGTYYYIVDFCKHDGEKGQRTGHVTVIRD